MNLIMTSYGWYYDAPSIIRIAINVFFIFLIVFLIVSAIYQIPYRNNKIKREVMDQEKEAIRLRVANEKATDKYIDLQKEYDKILSKKIQNQEDLEKLDEELKLKREELNILSEQKPADITKEPEKNKGGRPKGSKNTPKRKTV